MAEPQRLHADVPGSVAELAAAIKHFGLKRKLYRLLLRGKGIEFDGYRNFSADDDSSTIDWVASSRTNKLLVKQYREERDLKVVFLVDVGEHMVFGSTEKLKCEYATEVIGALAHLIISSGDRVGFILFNDSPGTYVRPEAGDRQYHRFIETLMLPQTYGGGSNIDEALKYTLEYVPQSVSSVIIVSDFLSFKERSRENFMLIAKKFETTALIIKDPLDYTLPDINGEFVIEDPKSGEQVLVNPKLIRKYYETYAREQDSIFKKECLKSNVDVLELTTNSGFVPTVAQYLKQKSLGGKVHIG